MFGVGFRTIFDCLEGEVARSRYLTIKPITSWEQCELVCCYRQLGCDAYTYTSADEVCKVWVSLEGTHTTQARVLQVMNRHRMLLCRCCLLQVPRSNRSKEPEAASTLVITSAKHRRVKTRTTHTCPGTTIWVLGGSSYLHWSPSRRCTCWLERWLCRRSAR